jgi:cytidylate kinase
MSGSIVAIDGPSASGKSSTAAAVARALGALHVDSGALYRGLARVGLDLPGSSAEALLRSAELRGLELRVDGAEIAPFLDGVPAESAIRTPAVTAAAAAIAAHPAIRAWVNERLRATARHGGRLVLDGRDIGTVVFPEARVKIFLTATAESRARRRLLQRGQPLDPAGVDREAALLAARDAADIERPVAPLRQAADAIQLDTTNLSFQEQVDAIVAIARGRLP